MSRLLRIGANARDYIARVLSPRTSARKQSIARGEASAEALHADVQSRNVAESRSRSDEEPDRQAPAARAQVKEPVAASQARYFAAVHHDLCQPLYAINLYLGALARLDLDQQANALVTKTRECVQTMDQMIRGLLELSRLDASAVQPKVEVFAIAPVLDGVRMQLESKARAKGVDLRVVDCAVCVNSDRGIVERMLFNLVENALECSRRGKILVGCRRRGARLRLEVHDTGPGIAHDHRHTVFDEMYQLDNPERDRARDLGLRLPIVRRMARLLALPLTLVSRSGQGSIIAIEVARAAPPTAKTS